MKEQGKEREQDECDEEGEKESERCGKKRHIEGRKQGRHRQGKGPSNDNEGSLIETARGGMQTGPKT